MSYSQVQCDGMNIIVRNGKVSINGVDAFTGKKPWIDSIAALVSVAVFSGLIGYIVALVVT